VCDIHQAHGRERGVGRVGVAALSHGEPEGDHGRDGGEERPLVAHNLGGQLPRQRGGRGRVQDRPGARDDRSCRVRIPARDASAACPRAERAVLG